MRIAIRARVSTRRQAQTQTIDQQLDRPRRVAADRRWPLPEDHAFRGDGYSGASLRRPGLDGLRDLAAPARLDRILVTDPDRPARNDVHQALLLEELQRHGGQVEFTDRPLSDDPQDRLPLQIRGAVAEYERTPIAERTRRGRLYELRSGRMLPRTRPPYGYRADPGRPRDPAGVRIDPAEAAPVAELFRWYADEGHSFTAAVRRLHDLGVRSPSGRGYRGMATIRGILSNPTYTGTIDADRTGVRYGTRIGWRRRCIGRAAGAVSLRNYGPDVGARGGADRARPSRSSGSPRRTRVASSRWASRPIPRKNWRRLVGMVGMVPRVPGGMSLAPFRCPVLLAISVATTSGGIGADRW